MAVKKQTEGSGMTDEEWRASMLRWRESVDLRLARLEQQGAVDAVHRTNVETRLGSIEDTLKWLVRLIIGALLLGFVAFILRGGVNLP